MLRSAFAVVLVVGSVGLAPPGFGQSGAASLVVPVSTDCQMDVQMEQRGAGTFLLVDGTKGKPIQIHLTLRNQQPVDVTGAEITVYGPSARGGVTEARVAQGGPAAMKKDVTLSVRVAAGGEAESDVALPGFTGVQMISIQAVTYADGTSWHASAGKTCHVTRGTTLISSR